jgi:biopolymer transport protein ExbD
MAAKIAGAGGGKYDLGQNNEINVTPFVDVMLVLLIIFMVAAPLATVSVEVTLPKAYAPPVKNPPKPVYVSLQGASNRIYVGDNRTSLETLCDDIKDQIGTRDPENERIYIRADQDVYYMNFMHVIAALQDCYFYSVALIGLDATGGKGS